jgi:hypothetical protein
MQTAKGYADGQAYGKNRHQEQEMDNAESHGFALISAPNNLSL